MAVSVLAHNTYRPLARVAIAVLVAAVVIAAFLTLRSQHTASSVKPAAPIVSPINNPSAAHTALSSDDYSCARPLRRHAC
jgi:flagellar assembly factor FliW